MHRCTQHLSVVVTSSIQGLQNSSDSSAHAQCRPASHLGARNCSIERFEFSVRRSKLPEAQNQSSISNERLFTRLRLPLLQMKCRGHVGLFNKWHIVLSLGGFAATHGSLKLCPQLPFSPEDSLKCPVQVIVSPERSLLTESWRWWRSSAVSETKLGYPQSRTRSVWMLQLSVWSFVTLHRDVDG